MSDTAFELEDGALVWAVQHGDGEAFSTLFRRHYPTVRRACVRRLGSENEGEEVAQAAFVRAYERIDQCAGDRRFGAWINVIALRLCVDSIRAQARVTLMEQPVLRGTASPDECEEAVLRTEEVAGVHHALDTLPARQRTVIVARDLEGRGPGEIAADLDLTVGAVDSLLGRARRKLITAFKSPPPAHVRHGRI